MTGPANAPRLIRGGIVLVDPRSGQVLRVIALQYNPDTLTRTLQPQAVTGEGPGPLGRAPTQGPADRDDQARRRDRRDRRPRASRRASGRRAARHRAAAGRPRDAALPAERAAHREQLAPGGRDPRDHAHTRRPEPVRVGQPARRPGAHHGLLDHRGGVRRAAQPAARQGQPVDARALGRRPRLRPQGWRAVPHLPAGEGAARAGCARVERCRRSA